ncbi:hypothetical protein [Micromonospora sp. NPDC005172]
MPFGLRKIPFSVRIILLGLVLFSAIVVSAVSLRGVTRSWT